MTTLDSRRDPDALSEQADATYDLIILNQGRLAFHDHHDTPQARLDRAVTQLTAVDTFSVVDGTEVLRIYNEHISVRSQGGHTDADVVLDSIAKLCRRWQIDIYLSTTHKRAHSSHRIAPATLYSVVTEYAPGKLVVEHFPTQKARHTDLIERAGQFIDPSEALPHLVLGDELRLAAFLSSRLTPALITLTESTLDDSDGVYRPVDSQLLIS